MHLEPVQVSLTSVTPIKRKKKEYPRKHPETKIYSRGMRKPTQDVWPETTALAFPSEQPGPHL